MGGGQTANNHATNSAPATSRTRPALLAFATAMDLEALQPRLQQALGQEFTVGPLLGEGAFAAVFGGIDNTLNRMSAVKCLALNPPPRPPAPTGCCPGPPPAR